VKVVRFPLLSYTIDSKINHYEKIKRVVLQLALQLDFLIAMVICNSMYFYTLSYVGQVALVAMNILYSHMQLYIIGNMCNSMQLGCPHRFPMQIAFE